MKFEKRLPEAAKSDFDFRSKYALKELLLEEFLLMLHPAPLQALRFYSEQKIILLLLITEITMEHNKSHTANLYLKN
jgi:hypothetical protein